MFRARIVLPALALCLAASSARAVTPGFAFLEVPVGARPAAMGGAFTAVADGVDGTFWNAAALAGVHGTQIAGGHTEFIQGLKHDQFAIAGELLGGGMAASLRAMYSQAIPARDELGNLTGTFGSHDLEFQLAYGRALTQALRLGVSGQVVRERLDTESATTWSGGAGAQWRASKGLRFGASVEHAGPAARYDIDGKRGDPVALPLALQAGAAWSRPLAHDLRVTAALDVRGVRGRAPVEALGAELAAAAGASVRLGLRNGDDLTSFAAGLGYRRGMFGVDYAWVPAKLDFGDTHRFSFDVQF